MDAIITFAKMFGDVLIAGIMIMLLSKQMIQAQSVAQREQEHQAQITAMKEYREWNSWDEKLVYAPDVISAILEYRGDPVVEINVKGANASNDWKRSKSYKKYTTANTKDTDIANIYTEFEDSTKRYKASLERNANGAVVIIHFVKQS